MEGGREGGRLAKAAVNRKADGEKRGSQVNGEVKRQVGK